MKEIVGFSPLKKKKKKTPFFLRLAIQTWLYSQ